MAKKKATKKATPAPAIEATAKSKPNAKKHIDSYAHTDKKRANNPPVGLVTSDSEPVAPTKKTYAYDPHLDPQLMWAGKSERTSFEVPTVSLHVHERIDPKAIIAAVRTNGDRAKPGNEKYRQLSLFEEPATYLPLRDALDFYKHPHGWTNRLIAGDSLLVMNSLLEKEGMAGKVQMIYIDPPYGIRYGSNFQPFVSKKKVEDKKDSDLTQEPEMIRAFRDTWELGIHSYLTYLRDRLSLANALLSSEGSVFVQIGAENLHLARSLLDEVFTSENMIAVIPFGKTTGATDKYLPSVCDYLIWYAKSSSRMKFYRLFLEKGFSGAMPDIYGRIELADGTRRRATKAELSGMIQPGDRIYTLGDLTSSRVREGRTGFYPIEFNGKEFMPGSREWSTHREGIERLRSANRLESTTNRLGFVRYIDDFPAIKLGNMWTDTAASFMSDKYYVVQTMTKVVERAMLMTTDPGDLVLDPTCGSGTTAFVAEQWGRRWVTCDTSRVALTLAKQRLMTASFDYYTLAHPKEGIGSGFKYKTVPHVTLKSIANNPEIVEGMSREAIDAAIKKYADQEVLYDQPEVDRSKARVTGPFTYEAVPAINVREIDDPSGHGPVAEPMPADGSISRSGVTSRQDEWRDELARTGVRGKGGTKLEFLRLEPLPGTRYLHAVGETKDKQARTVAVSFGPEHAPLEQRHVELAWEEARGLKPKPKVLLFAAFHFDPEAAKDIDELDPKKAGMQLLKLQMNTDLLTDDLKKKRSSNESFWLVGQPDVTLRKIHRGPDSGLWEVEVHGFDYYNPSNGKIESGDTSRIAMWLLDTDYDGRSLLPRQVFFPMSGEKDGWSRLSKNLKAEIDEDLIEAYRGTVSLPFDMGRNRRIAAKIIDDRGIECLKIINVE
jgi:adenine-specific DNA-methyltransferase